jgi:molecular chaperone HtpG
VAGGSGPDRELERLLSRQSRGLSAKPILEINTRHAMVKAISDAKLGGRDADVTDLAELLFDTAQILDGEVPADPAAFARRMSRLVTRGLGAG